MNMKALPKPGSREQVYRGEGGCGYGFLWMSAHMRAGAWTLKLPHLVGGDWVPQCAFTAARQLRKSISYPE